MLVVMNDECMRMRIASALLGCTWSVLSALFCCRWCVASSLLRTRVAELWLSSQWAKRASKTMLVAINDACLCIHLLYPPLCIPPLHLCLLMSLYHAPPPLSHTGSFQHTEQTYLSSSTGRFSICRNGITGQFSIFRNGIKPTGVDPRPLCAFVFGNKSRVLMYPSALVPSLHLCVSLPCSSPPSHTQAASSTQSIKRTVPAAPAGSLSAAMASTRQVWTRTLCVPVAGVDWGSALCKPLSHGQVG